MFWRLRPTPEDLQHFSEVLKTSRLLSEAEIDDQLHRFKRQVKKLSAIKFADFLVEGQILTRWQCDKLLNNQYKGFFIDNYLLVGHHDFDDDYSYYVAKDLINDEQVVMAVVPKSRLPEGDRSLHYHIIRSGNEST